MPDPKPQADEKAQTPRRGLTAVKWLRRLRRRLWMRRHMRHPYLNRTGHWWRCSCGATYRDPSPSPGTSA